MNILVFQKLIIEYFLDFLYFPLWWYTSGFFRCSEFCWNLFKNGNSRLAPGLWLKNMFVPMFGQIDWQGKIVSFYVRLMNVIIRGILLFFWLFFVVLVLAVWLIFPVLIVYMFFVSIF